jgi:hypothetical protein
VGGGLTYRMYNVNGTRKLSTVFTAPTAFMHLPGSAVTVAVLDHVLVSLCAVPELLPLEPEILKPAEVAPGQIAHPPNLAITENSDDTCNMHTIT